MTTKERRKLLRITTEFDGEYWAKGPSMTSGQVQIRDFSRDGLGVSFPKPVCQGEHVDITLKVPGDNVPVFASAEVAWSEESAGPEGTGAGLKFLSINPLDLARLLDHVYSHWLGKLRQQA